MIQAKTNLSKWILMVFIITLSFSIGFFMWGRQLLSVSGTITCFVHRFALEQNTSVQLMSDLKNLLKQQNFKPKEDKSSSFSWSDQITYVMMYLNTSAKGEHQISVCTENKKSKSWQKIVLLIEAKLPTTIRHISANLELDPAVLNIAKENNYSGFTSDVEISLPITIEKLNNVEKNCREKLKLIDKKSNLSLSCKGV